MFTRVYSLGESGVYGKLFVQMYDGTLATRGPWQALVTFQQMIILADSTGVVDMTAEAIARRTTVPIEIINIGITALEQPDAESRTPALEGRRIVRLSDDRAWGWQIVNHEHYRKMRSQEERREYMRLYQRARRAAADDVNNSVNNVSNVNPCSKQYAVSNKTQREKSRSTSKPVDNSGNGVDWTDPRSVDAYGKRIGKPCRPGESIARYAARLRGAA